MTIFSALLSASGMTQKQAAEFLKTNEDTVRNWARGRIRTPEGVVNEMRELIKNIVNASNSHDFSNLPEGSVLISHGLAMANMDLIEMIKFTGDTQSVLSKEAIRSRARAASMNDEERRAMWREYKRAERAKKREAQSN